MWYFYAKIRRNEQGATPNCLYFWREILTQVSYFRLTKAFRAFRTSVLQLKTQGSLEGALLCIPVQKRNTCTQKTKPLTRLLNSREQWKSFILYESRWRHSEHRLHRKRPRSLTLSKSQKITHCQMRWACALCWHLTSTIWPIDDSRFPGTPQKATWVMHLNHPQLSQKMPGHKWKNECLSTRKTWMPKSYQVLTWRSGIFSRLPQNAFASYSSSLPFCHILPGTSWNPDQHPCKVPMKTAESITKSKPGHD